MAARGTTVERMAAMGVDALSPQQGLSALGVALQEGTSQVAVAPIDWPRLVNQLGRGPVPPLLQDIVAQVRATGDGTAAASAQAAVDYAGLAADERHMRLVALVRRELATVLALPDAGRSIVDDQPFSTLGLDSLTSVELRNRLQRTLGRPLAATVAFEWPCASQLAHHLSSLFGDAAHDDTREEVTL